MLLVATQLIQAISDATTTPLQAVADWQDQTNTGPTPGVADTSIANSTVTLVASPTGGAFRSVKSINIFNPDSVAHSVTVTFYDGSTASTLVSETIGAYQTLFYSGATGWQNVGASGAISVVPGKVLSVSNSLTLAGTDGTTMTFPSTSATLARTDGSNVFIGHQTLEGVTSTGATGTGNLVFSASPTFAGTVIGPDSGTWTSGGLHSIAKLGVGMTPANIVDVTQNQNGESAIQLLNNNGGTAAEADFILSNGTHHANLTLFGTNFTTSGLARTDGAALSANGAGGLTLCTTAAQPIYFGINSAEQARLTSNALLVGTTNANGDVSNSKTIIAGQFTTWKGTASIPNGGATVTVTGLSPSGSYLVTWNIAGSGGWATGTGSLSGGDPNSAPTLTTLNAGGYTGGGNTFSVTFRTKGGVGQGSFNPLASGAFDLVVSQSSGSAATISYSVTQIGPN